MHKNNYNLIKNQFNKNATKLHALDFIYREIATRMISRLNYIKINPSRVLDIGSGLNIDAELLYQKFPQANIIRLDMAIELLKLNHKKSGFVSSFMHQLAFKNILKTFKFWKRSKDKSLANTPPRHTNGEILQQTQLGSNTRFKDNELICANAIALPIANQSINLVWSNLVLPYIDNIKGFLQEINRVLTINGTLLISGLAVDSLQQLRDIGLRTYNFPDMHIIGDLLLKTGFTNPVTDVEYITLKYDNFEQLLKDIKVIGCGAVQAPTTKITRAEYLSIKTRFMQITKNGTIPLTLEIFYAHAWKDRVVIPLPDGKNIIQFHPQK